MNNLISIIIPTFNQGNYIERCLNSILKQSYKNYEVIIIDKFSTDDTKQIINQFTSLPIKFFQIENGGVIANSRNFGIKKAKGDLIAFLDSDDYWKPNKLEICLKKINAGNDFVFHNLQISGSEKIFFFNKILKSRKLNKPYFKDLLINGNLISNSSVVLKKKLLFEVDLINEEKKMNAAEDYNLWIKVSKKTEKFCFINEVLGFYQYNLDGASRKKNMSYSTMNAVKYFYFSLNKKEINYSRARIIYLGAKYFYNKKKYDKCLKKLFISLKYGKFNIKLKSLLLIILIRFNW